MAHSIFVWDLPTHSGSAEILLGSGTEVCPPIELSGYRLSTTYAGDPVPTAHLGGTVLARGTTEDAISGRIVEVSYDEMRKLDQSLTLLSRRQSMEFPGGRTAWVYVPSGGLEPREPEFTFHNLEVTLDEASSTLTSAPKIGDVIVLTGVRARAGRRATENLWKESRLVTIQVQGVTSGWGVDGIERIEGLVRHGDWLLSVVAFVRIGVETPYVGALEISNVATYSPATRRDVPSSDLYEDCLRGASEDEVRLG